jgi:hypothetical protein
MREYWSKSQVKDSLSYELRSPLVTLIWEQFYVLLKYLGNFKETFLNCKLHTLS